MSTTSGGQRRADMPIHRSHIGPSASRTQSVQDVTGCDTEDSGGAVKKGKSIHSKTLGVAHALSSMRAREAMHAKYGQIALHTGLALKRFIHRGSCRSS